MAKYIENEIDVDMTELSEIYLKTKIINYKVSRKIKNDILEKIDEKFGEITLEETPKNEEVDQNSISPFDNNDLF